MAHAWARFDGCTPLRPYTPDLCVNVRAWPDHSKVITDARAPLGARTRPSGSAKTHTLVTLRPTPSGASRGQDARARSMGPPHRLNGAAGSTAGRLVNRARIATIALIPPEQGQDIVWTTDT